MSAKNIGHEVEYCLYDELEYATHTGDPEQVPSLGQTELVGDPFRRIIPKGSTAGDAERSLVLQQRRVRIIAVLNERTGTIEFFPIDRLPPHATPSDLPHIELADAGKIYDRAEEGIPSLSTARKSGASKPFVDTAEKIRARHGNPDYRVPKSKQGGWFRIKTDEKIK